MVHICPYCSAGVSSGPEDTEREDARQIAEVWFCPSCKRSFTAEYVFSEYYDSDGDPIPDREEP